MKSWARAPPPQSSRAPDLEPEKDEDEEEDEEEDEDESIALCTKQKWSALQAESTSNSTHRGKFLHGKQTDFTALLLSAM